MDFFTDGFSLKDVDEKFQHLSMEEKTQILQDVIEALNLDLKRYSSADKRKKYLVIKENQDKAFKKLNPPSSAQRLKLSFLKEEQDVSPRGASP